MFLAINLGGIGINTPANEIPCNADGENGVSVKLFGDTDFENRVVSVLHDRKLATANTISELLMFMPQSVKRAFTADVMKNGVDSYDELIKKIREYRSPETTVKFYCPLKIQFYERNEYGDIDDSNVTELDGRFAGQYEDEIKRALEKYTARDEIDMVEYFDGGNGATAKLKSMQWGVENVGNELFGAITVKLSEPLTENEKVEVVDFISGQNSDGYASKRIMLNRSQKCRKTAPLAPVDST